MPTLQADKELANSLEGKNPGIPDQEPGLGTVLAGARNRKKLSKKTVANALNLSQSIIEALENDKEPVDIPAAYVRGYQRSYIRYLDLDEMELLGDSSNAHTAISSGHRSYNLGRPVRIREKSRVLPFVLKSLVGVAIIGVAYLFWPKIAQLIGLDDDIHQTEAVEGQVVVKQLQGTEHTTEEDTAAASEGVNQTVVKKIVIPADLDQTEFTREQPDQGDNSAISVDPASDIQPETGPDVSAEETMPEQESLPAEESSITVVSNGKAWLSITDANGKRLYEGTLRLDRRTFEALLPLKIATGNLPDLRLLLENGEQQKVDVFDNNPAVAKFTVDKGEDGRLVFYPQ